MRHIDGPPSPRFARLIGCGRRAVSHHRREASEIRDIPPAQLRRRVQHQPIKTLLRIGNPQTIDRRTPRRS
jgi:hypothetical protein